MRTHTDAQAALRVWYAIWKQNKKTTQTWNLRSPASVGLTPAPSPLSFTDTHCHLCRTCMKYSTSPHLIVWSAIFCTVRIKLYKLLICLCVCMHQLCSIKLEMALPAIPLHPHTLKTWLADSQRTIRVSFTMGAGASVLPPAFREPTENWEDHSLQQMPFKAEAHCSTAENRCEKPCV